jgi:hypothetical protein
MSSQVHLTFTSTVGGAAAIANAHVAQTHRILHVLSNLMKDCNFLLTTLICNSFNMDTMTVYQHMTNLDFVIDATSCQSNFVHLPPTDTRYPHLKLFQTGY